MMDPTLVLALVQSGLKLAADLSSLALQQGATPEQIQAAWDAQRTDWNKDWAEWQAMNAGSPR